MEKVKGGKRSWLFCYRRSRAFNFVVHAIHIYQAMTDRQQQQKWTKGLNYSTAVSANGYKTQTTQTYEFLTRKPEFEFSSMKKKIVLFSSFLEIAGKWMMRFPDLFSYVRKLSLIFLDFSSKVSNGINSVTIFLGMK